MFGKGCYRTAHVRTATPIPQLRAYTPARVCAKMVNSFIIITEYLEWQIIHWDVSILSPKLSEPSPEMKLQQNL